MPKVPRKPLKSSEQMALPLSSEREYPPNPSYHGKITGPLPGTRIAHWTVLGYSHKEIHGRTHRQYFWCRCDCGREKQVLWADLQRGGTSSCLWCATVRHGGYRNQRASPEYATWCAMHSRCRRPRNASYARYGGRGIRVCERWNSFENFLADMGPRPSLAHQIDRVDNNGNYEPSNCKWSSISEQANNRCTNRNITVGGETLTVVQWAHRLGVSTRVIWWRLGAGWSEEQAVTEPLRTDPRGRPRKLKRSG
jgi:hypothetical protein